jgi:hypothetical protein
VMRRSAVDAGNAATRRSFERIGLETTPASHVPDGDLFIWQDVRRPQQVGIEGD